MTSSSSATAVIKPYEVYGIIERYSIANTPRDSNVITATCFGGVGMFNCVAGSSSLIDPFSYNLGYYDNINTLLGQNYCLQCCGSNPDMMDLWDMYCPVDATWESKLSSIQYIGAEFRMARMRTMVDTEHVKCPLKSTLCTYDDNGNTLSCNLTPNAPNTTYIIGYELTLNVAEYSENFQYWRGVTSCSAISKTRSTPLRQGETFHEKIIMLRTPIDLQPYGFSYDLIYLSFLTFLIVIFLYFCRRANCVVCQSKLIIFFDRCFICRLFGAHLPDPLIMEALEEKGRIIQAEAYRPERFPGSTIVLAFARTFCCNFNYCFPAPKIKPYDAKEMERLKRMYEEEPEQGWCYKLLCDRGDDPESKTVFEAFCCCISSVYMCCCYNTKPKRPRVQVVRLPLEPYVVYDAISHPRPPKLIEQQKQSAMMQNQFEEDMELFGDLTAGHGPPPDRDTPAYAAMLRMIAYKESIAVKSSGWFGGMFVGSTGESTKYPTADSTKESPSNKDAVMVIADNVSEYDENEPSAAVVESGKASGFARVNREPSQFLMKTPFIIDNASEKLKQINAREAGKREDRSRKENQKPGKPGSGGRK